MKTIEESVVTAMDGNDVALYPYLPYIMQDLWEFGADPEIFINLIRKHFDHFSELRVLDLGCGKGASSVKIAQVFDCKCLGIDAVKEFIQDARKKAREYGVEHLCSFEQADIRERVKGLQNFDLILLGAVGPVLGDYYQTLTTLAPCLAPEGMIMIDDGYIEPDSDITHPLIFRKKDILEQIGNSGMRLLDEMIIAKDHIVSEDERLYKKVKQRCMELIDKYPQKRSLFEDYIKKQEEENDVLENKITCSVLVIGQ
ncbi:MAG: class I SAM-dependent methyltransferase [FCB group bacterium]|nr:class I SAM-dependent methyltransferase [FCB group bacterium]